MAPPVAMSLRVIVPVPGSTPVTVTVSGEAPGTAIAGLMAKRELEALGVTVPATVV
jgi:hypothetical protein